MNRFDVMLSYVPSYYHDSKIFKSMLKAEGEEFDQLRTAIEDLKSQFFVDTATWGLALWEKEYGLPTNTKLSLDERRSILKGKIQGIGKVGAELIKSVGLAYSNGEVKVEFDRDIKVTFIGTRGIPSRLEELQKQLEDIIPAHLKIIYKFTYLLWSEFDLLTAEVQESMTWEELEVYKP